MKKILVLLFVMVIVVATCACSSQKSNSSNDEPNDVPEVTEPEEEDYDFEEDEDLYEEDQYEDDSVIDGGYSADEIMATIEEELEDLKDEDEVLLYNRSDNKLYLFINWWGDLQNTTTGIQFFEGAGNESAEIQSPDDEPGSMSIHTTEKSIDGGSTYIKGVGAKATAKILEIVDEGQYKGSNTEDDLMDMINDAGSNMSNGAGTSTKEIGSHEVTLTITDKGSDGVEEVFTVSF